MRHEARLSRMPLILRAAERRNIDRACETVSGIRPAGKRNPHPVRSLLIAIHQHDGPLPVRTLHCIRRYQFMAGAVFHVALRGKCLMIATRRLHPVQIDELSHEKLRQWLLNLIVRVHREHSKRSWRTAASRLHLQRQIVKEIDALATGVQERSDVIGQPDPGENVLIRFACTRREVAFGDQHWHVRGNAVLMPHLHDVAHQIGFVIKHSPRRVTWLKGIVLEGEECEIVHPAVLFQIVEKTSHPRDLALRVRPDLDIAVHSLERWAAQF